MSWKRSRRGVARIAARPKSPKASILTPESLRLDETPDALLVLLLPLAIDALQNLLRKRVNVGDPSSGRRQLFADHWQAGPDALAHYVLLGEAGLLRCFADAPPQVIGGRSE